jgi:release factor glutamine methyltransferase
MLTLLEIIKKTTEFFTQRGVESPRLNAELLIGHALGLQRMQLYLQFERPLAEAELEKIRPLVRRRGQREPLQYILGTTEFSGLALKTDKRALIPRPETERLVEIVIERTTVPPARILDLGTGTGAIALALAKQFADAQVVAVDRDAQALALAAENAQATGLGSRVSFLESDWFSALPAESRFDLIVANPPYLTAEETNAAAAEVRDHEPRAALESGGADGMDDLRRILESVPKFLTENGWVALETGIAQHTALRQCAEANGFSSVESLQDLTGRDRFVIARR